MTGLNNKTVIVTGASGGLGKATALELARKGANVVVHYHSNQKEAESIMAAIMASGGHALAVQADVSVAEGVHTLFEQSIAHFGSVDMVINNAGIMITKMLKDFTEEEFDYQFRVNVKSVFLVMKAAAEKLNPNGRIINISSSTSRLMLPAYSVYAATKAAIEQMTRVFAKEIGSTGITVNAVLPGPVNTELFLNGKSEAMVRQIAGLAVQNRIGNPEDIIPMILFLCTDEAQWITGQCLGVNGGMA